MIYLHGDVSGKSDGAVIAAACYLGKESDWQRAADGWAEVLASEKINMFHATDFYSGWGPFAGDEWKIPRGERMIPGGQRHEAFAARITAVAESAGLLGFAFGMNPATFNEHLKPVFELEDRKVKCTNPQLYAIMRTVCQVSNFLDAAPAPLVELGRGRIVFEEELSASGLWVDYFTESQLRTESWTKWYAALTTAGKEIVSVQLADLLAHEAWRRVSEVYKDNPRPIRKSFARMLLNERIEVQMLTEEDAKASAAHLRDLVEHFPNGLVPPSPMPGAPATLKSSVAQSAVQSWADRQPER